jgi:hypothetical protein
MDFEISKPLEQIVSGIFADNKKIKDYWNRCGRTLTSYAKSIGSSKERLTVLDLFNENTGKDLSFRFVDFVNRSKNTPKYKSQLKAGTKTVVNAVCALHNKETNEASSSIVPDFFKPVLQFLPRHPGCNVKYGSPERLNYPLSETGQSFFTTCLLVIEKHKIKDLESLFTTQRHLVIERFKQDFSYKKSAVLEDAFRKIATKVEFPSFKNISKKSINLEEFPPKLKEQIKTFIENATTGLQSDPALVVRASSKNVNIEKLELSSIRGYIEVLELGIGQIKFDDYENINIESLLDIRAESRLDEEGGENIYLFNPYVEQYRTIEKNRVSKRKRKGFDSQAFTNFIIALRAVAAYNRIFRYHEIFRQAYSPVIDKQSRKDFKQKKRESFSIEWMDSEIARLSIEFRKIIKDRSFKDERNKRTFFEYRRNLKLCFFFVQLVTLRYNGFRQQMLRDCEIGVNIIFNSDNSIKLFWRADQIKNDRSYSNFYSPTQHGRTSGLLIETLNAFYKIVYPYVKAKAKGDLENQLFVRFKQSGFGRYDADDHTEFSACFKRFVLDYLNYKDELNQIPEELHAHFFRALCGLSLKKDGADADEIANVLGDTKQTVEQNYLPTNEGYDARFVFDKLNADLKREEELEAEVNGNKNTEREELERLRAENKKLHERGEVQEAVIRALINKGSNDATSNSPTS